MSWYWVSLDFFAFNYRFSRVLTASYLFFFYCGGFAMDLAFHKVLFIHCSRCFTGSTRPLLGCTGLFSDFTSCFMQIAGRLARRSIVVGVVPGQRRVIIESLPINFFPPIVASSGSLSCYLAKMGAFIARFSFEMDSQLKQNLWHGKISKHKNVVDRIPQRTHIKGNPVGMIEHLPRVANALVLGTFIPETENQCQ